MYRNQSQQKGAPKIALIAHIDCGKRASVPVCGLLAFLITATAQAEIYKCIVDGNVEYSDKRCAPNAKKIVLEPISAGVNSPDRLRVEDSRNSGGRNFSNCSEARAAGAAPVRRGDPGYGPRLDRDGDGIGCE